ncbi:MAG: hypothetical protein FD177_253 [Desulfovibrionaceae bacterium]|nr:MAG: hypothetical protein FD177_253 [Desulfovibrionaceae bacterium]
MKVKHTKGPWERDGAPNDKYPCIYTCDATSDDILIAQVFGGQEDQPTVNEAGANADLIAAAPDLYEALVRSKGQWIHSVNAPICLAAIAKAGGK